MLCLWVLNLSFSRRPIMITHHFVLRPAWIWADRRRSGTDDWLTEWKCYTFSTWFTHVYQSGISQSTSFPGSLSPLREGTLVTAGHVSARFWQTEGRGLKVEVCLHWAHLLSPVESGICNPPVMDRQTFRQNSQRRPTHSMLELNAFNAGLKLAFPVDSRTVFGIYGGEKFWQRIWK